MNTWALLVVGFACALGTSGTRADGLVSFDLASPQDGARVAPGARVEWTITVRDSVDDNLGLALACVDLVQEPNNPELFDLPPAPGAPPGMENFDRPWGICNPGPSGSGYGGTPVGPAGERNLVQIGGAQNTLGAPLGPIGLDTDAETGVGRGPGGQVLAEGEFRMPSTPGVYTFLIVRPRANTLASKDDGSGRPIARWADALIGAKMFRIVVECRADLNADGAVDAFDFLLFIDGLSRGEAGADLNGDGEIDALDAAEFLRAAGEGCANP